MDTDNHRKTKEELIRELAEARRRVAELESMTAGQGKPRERARNAAGVNESEERYRAAIEHSDDGVAVVKGEELLYVNVRFLEIFGYASTDEVVGKSIEMIVHPDDRKKIGWPTRPRQGREAVRSKYEFRGIRKDGSVVYIERWTTAITFGGERVALAYLRDITDRKQAQEALHARVEAEGFISTISTRFIDIRNQNIDNEIHNVLRSITDLAGIEHAYLVLLATDGEGVDRIYGSSRNGARPGSGPLHLLLPVEWVKEKLRSTDVLHVSALDDLPEEAQAEKETWRLMGIGSVLAVPLVMNRQLTGFMGFAAQPPEKRWAEEDVTVLRLIGDILTNVLNRKRMGEELRLNEARTKALLNAIPDTMYRIRTDGIILDFKADQKKLPGWDKSWAGRQLAETPLSGKTSSDILGLIRQAVETGRVRRYEFDMTVGDSVRIFETRIVKSGKDEAVCIVRNVTDQRQAEQALRESESKFRSIAEQSMVGVYLIQDDHFLYVNERFAEVFGYRIEEIVGVKNPLDLAHADHRMTVEENIRKRLTGDTHAIHYEFTGVRKDGEPVYAEAYGVRTLYRSRPAIVGTLLDRTEGKKLEAQLIQAEKMKAIGALAGGIAHDFNNLLMSIQGYTSLMLHYLKPDDLHYDKLKGIEELVESGSELTKQLLTFASGGTYQIRQADLNEIVKRTSVMFARTKKEITIQQRYENAPCVVDVDSAHIEQILLNLYLNAWQAMAGGGTLSLETRNVVLDKEFVKPHSVKPGRYARISVTDTGEGMDQKTKERIFEPFFTTKKMGRGTGIGLASVYSVIKGHHGIINVFSEKGCGTSFHIYLPMSKKVIEKRAPVPDEVVEGDETILIVDDEESVISVSRDMLEALGYQVLVARSGHEAVEVYERDHKMIDLVILDMVMPDMGGEETFTRLQGINPDVAVVLSSGYSLDGLTTTIMEQGCKAFIQKPFTIGVLSQRLAEVLGRTAASD